MPLQICRLKPLGIQDYTNSMIFYFISDYIDVVTLCPCHVALVAKDSGRSNTFGQAEFSNQLRN